MESVLTLFRLGITELPRRRLFHVKRLVFTAVAGLLVAWTFGAAVYNETPVSGLDIFLRLSYFAIVGACLAAPLTTATVFARERESRTLGLLLMSDLSPSSLVLGRLLGGLWYMVLILLSVVPMLLLCLSLGGVGALQVAYALAIGLSSLWLGASLGLFASSLAANQKQASFLALLMTGAVFIALPSLSYFLIGLLPVRTWVVWWQDHVLPATSPVLAFRSLMAQSVPYVGLAWCALAVCGSLVLHAFTVHHLPHDADEPDNSAFNRWRDGFMHWQRRPFRPKRDDENPLVWKEQPQSLWLLCAYSMAAALIVAAPWGLLTNSFSYTLSLTVFVVSALIFSLSVIVRCGMAFGAEMENRTLDLLVLAGMGEDEIIMGKYWGFVRGYSPWLVTLGASLLLFSRGDYFDTYVIATILFVTITFAYSQLAMLMSLMARKTLAVIGSVVSFCFGAAMIPMAMGNIFLAVALGGIHLALGLYLMHRLYSQFRPLAIGV